MNTPAELLHPSRKHLLPGMHRTTDKQKAALLDNLNHTGYPSGRSSTQTKGTLTETLQDNTLIPTAYTTDTEGNMTPTAYIQRDPTPYQHVFAAAQTYVLQHMTDQMDATEKSLLYCQAITTAIAEQLRPDQTDAEKNKEALLHEARAENENIVTTDQVAARDAEVCVEKSAIAYHFLMTNDIPCEPELHADANYENNEGEGHMYLTVTIDGQAYEFHPNSPKIESGTDGKITYAPNLQLKA